MKRGRKNQPTALHRLHGTIETRHRQRPPDIAAPGTLGEPPADLTPAEQDSWRHAIEHSPAGILARIDESIMRLWSVTEARYLHAKAMQDALDSGNKLPLLVKTRAGDLTPSPYVGIMNKSAVLMLRMVEQLGFCPTARVGLGKAEEADEEDGRWLQVEELRRKAANAR
jgi:phage terminase small subunit